MSYSKKESAQATVELVVLLLGFISVFLGLILVCGLADSDISVLLQARNKAEKNAANSVLTVGGAEFGSLRSGTHDVYDTSEELVFSPQDYVGRSFNNSLKAFHPELNKKTEFETVKPAVYTQQAELKEWKSLRNADQKLFISDFVPSLSNKNALEAAVLVSGTAQSMESPFLISGCASCSFAAGLSSWFGLKVEPENLKYAAGNRVYMPLFSRQDNTK